MDSVNHKQDNIVTRNPTKTDQASSGEKSRTRKRQQVLRRSHLDDVKAPKMKSPQVTNRRFSASIGVISHMAVPSHCRARNKVFPVDMAITQSLPYVHNSVI